MATPYCPECGSVRIKKDRRTGRCLEPDCFHSGPWRKFSEHAGWAPTGRQAKWRDPIALLPGDYEDYN